MKRHFLSFLHLFCFFIQSKSNVNLIDFMKGGKHVNLLFSNHTKVANKWLVLLSGLNRNGVDHEGKKIYEYQYFNIPKSWRETKWNKVMIKQVLAYLGLADSKGDLGVVDLEELASILQCSVRSLKNNHKTLLELNLIEVENLYGELVHIKLVDYLHNFLDLDPSGRNSTGYTKIKKEALFEIFKMDKVTVIRLVCRALYEHEANVNSGAYSSILLDSETLKGFLPRYATYKPAMRKIVHNIRGLFCDVEFYNVKNDRDELLQQYKQTPLFIRKLKSAYILNLKLDPSKDSRYITEKEISAVRDNEIIKKLQKETSVVSIDLESFSELVYEFGRGVVEKAIDEFTTYFKNGQSSKIPNNIKSDFRDFWFTEKPIGPLRKILRKYALREQEGYFANV